MLLPEHVDRYRNLPFNMEFTNIKEEPPHFHRELEIAFVLRGWVKYKMFNQFFPATRGQMVIVETDDLHYICDSSDDLIMITTHIDLVHFGDRYPDIDYMVFACEYDEEDDEETRQRLMNKVSVFKTYLSELMYMTLADNADDSLVSDKLDTIIAAMVEHLQGFHFDNYVFKTFHDPASQNNLQKLYGIYKYIYTHYSDKLTLESVAKATGFSPFYISHLVKDVSGLTFQELINYTRVEFAEIWMQNESLSLTQVSEFSGFSSPSYFNKCFKAWHGITPAEYKKQTRPKKRVCHGNLNQPECIAILREYIQNPIDLSDTRRNELNNIIKNLDNESLQLLLQVARRLS